MISTIVQPGKKAMNMLYLIIAIEFVLVSLFLFNAFYGEYGTLSYRILNKLSGLDGERNFPALFSSTQLLSIGILFILMLFDDNFRNFSTIRFYLVVGLLFIFLAFDEAFQIHEQLSDNFKDVQWLPRFKGDHGLWVFPYIIAGILLAGITVNGMFKFWKSKRKEAVIMGVGLFLFLLGVLGAEVFSYLFLRDGQNETYYIIGVALEEFLEMFGVSLILYATILLYLEGRTAKSAVADRN